MQFSIVSALALVSVVLAENVITQIGDGQIQAPTTTAPETTKTPEVETTTSTTAVETSTTSSEVPQYSNAAPRAVVGGGLAAIAGLAVLL